MTSLRFPLLTLLVISMACASGSGRKSADDIPYPQPQSPEWVAAPHVEGGLAATECVDDNAPRSMLSRKAAALARAKLAEELQASVDSLTKEQSTIAANDGGTAWSQDTQSAVNQLASETMTNSRVARSDYVTSRGKTEFCVMVVVDKATTSQLKENIKQATNSSPDDINTMWRAFNRAGKELDMEQDLER